ncbi:MAG: sigma-70 family RNA polymerase sigma factor [Thermoanaerobaculia bacterium]|nr:sigma-70 family RNA polymerase sigma factor [Thermoanaerobaculia bacterium]
MRAPSNDPEEDDADLQSTAVLIEQARSGEDEARDQLMARYVPILHRWARGRLPAYARDLSETADLVQITLLRALRNLDRFESRGEGAFLGYLRQILLNAIRDEKRRTARRPSHGELPERLVDQEPSALEQAIGRAQMERYEVGLGKLEERQRQAVILRLEFGYSHAQIAEAIEAPSPNAARMVVSRGLLRLAEAINP